MTSGAITARPASAPASALTWLTTTDHKRIGIMYTVAAFGFFMVGGVLALLMRAELAQPGLQVMGVENYDQSFTMHGTIMMLLFGTPMVAAFANYLVPLQIGAADMVFPRLNALSFWLFLSGGLIVLSGYLEQSGPADIGWTGYTPLSEPMFSTSTGTDLWIVGLALTGLASIMGAVNFVATIFTRRAPGMSMFRLPMFCWGILATSVLILFAFPAITAALAMLLLDRRFGASFFVPQAGGDPILWQHLFWFFGHPEVYILALPFFGILSEVIPVFSRKPLFGYRAMALAMIGIAFL
ncbi:MAG TPA: cbb3-type cytochrome c oxidase subunit I, partial [Candidatus Limnocylindrales bacterium]|nr:cbb3-type cytochrome c oxidase subunit I [Candidatus Limnocylindrales bacterium]